MKRSLKNLLAFTIKATDGEKGTVKDFLFDEKKWIIRYLEVDLGSFFIDKKVLIGRTFLDVPMWNESLFPIKLSKADIEKAPGLEAHLPISMKYEEEYNKHFRLLDYWNLPDSAMGVMDSYMAIKVPTQYINEKKLGTNLRSFREVENYHVHTPQGMLGHVYDLIVDDENWQVVYAIIDTSNWMPWSKKVVIPIQHLKEISYVNNEIKINLSIENIKNSPEYNENAPFISDYEMMLYEFYNRNM